MKDKAMDVKDSLTKTSHENQGTIEKVLYYASKGFEAFSSIFGK